MKKINVVGVSLAVGAVIALCVMSLSITHASAFFERSGYHRWLAVSGVIAIELLFLYGSSLTLWLWLRGEHIPGATKTATFLGVLVNLYSNLTSGIAQDGKPIIWTIRDVPISEPVIAGVLITLIYIVAELVISDAIKAYRRRSPSQTSTNDQPSANPLVEVIEDQPVIDQPDQPQPPISQPLVEVADQSATNQLKAMGVVGEVVLSANEQPVNQPSANDQPSPVSQPEPEALDTTDQPALTSQPKLTMIKGSAKDQPLVDHPANQLAEDYHKKHGEWPSERGLVELAEQDGTRISRYKAGQILKRLKAEAS